MSSPKVVSFGSGGATSLNPARIQFKGKMAVWDLQKWLPPALRLAFLEPMTLARPTVDPGTYVWPRSGYTEDSVLDDLYAKLDGASMLGISRGTRDEHRRAVPFNMHKDKDRDRFLLDRRGENGTECKLAGFGSSSLFPGYRLTELHRAFQRRIADVRSRSQG